MVVMPFAKEAEVQRTCWKCEGSVSVHMPQCPYCSAFLQDPPASPGGFSSCHISLSDDAVKGETDDLFAVSSEDWEAVLNKPHSFQESKEKLTAHWQWLQHWPTLISILGSGLFVFALMILFFADDSGLTLTWPKNRAILYGVLGAVLAYKGYQKLAK